MNFKQLYKLPDIPPKIEKLHIVNCYLQELPNLKSCKLLKSIKCHCNKLKEISNLPDSLEYLNCGGNRDVTRLIDLPKNIKYLNCSNTSVYLIHIAPFKLQTLISNNTNIKRLPIFRSKIICLQVNNNRLETITDSNIIVYFPPTIRYLSIKGNYWIFLGHLPPNLIYLDCSLNRITNLKKLPKTLKYLNCSYNNLKQIGKLSLRLKTLICSGNKITKLPTLPIGIEIVIAHDNLINEFPKFKLINQCFL